MINISLKDASALDRALQKIVDDAEQATMGAVRGVVGYAVAYLVPRTPQWSGEMVSQWRVTASDSPAPRAVPNGYKDQVPFPITDENRAEVKPYHAVHNPNEDAIVDVRNQLESDVAELFRTGQLLHGAAIWLPYDLDDDDSNAGWGMLNFAGRHPGFKGVIVGVDDRVKARFRSLNKQQAQRYLKQPFPWAEQEKGARTAYSFKLGVPKDDKAREREAKRVEKIQARAGERYEAKRIKRAEKARKAEEIKRIRSEISATKKTRRIVKRRVSSEGKRTELSALERKIADLDAQLSVLRGLENKPTNVDKSKSRPQPQKKKKKSPVEQANDKPQSGSILDTFVFNANKRR